MKKKIRHWIEELNRSYGNLSLRRKIVLIISLANVLLLTALIVFSVQLINKTNDRLLDKSISNQFTESAKTINDALSNIVALSKGLVNDSYLMEVSIQGIEMDRDYLQNLIQNHMSPFKTEMISFIDLDMGGTRISLYEGSNSQRPNNTIYTALVRRGVVGAGGRWSTRFSNDSQIYYSQAVSGQASTGVLVIGVDMTMILKDIVESADDSLGYVLIDEVNYVVYADESLGEINVEALRSLKRNDYTIITQKNENYFVVNMPLAGYSMDYFIFTPYENITSSINKLMITYIVIITFSIIFSVLLAGRLISILAKDYDQLIYKMKNFRGDGGTILQVQRDYHGRKDEVGLLHQHFNSMAEEIHELIQMNYTNEILIREARIKELETQINPHFLYNTLESINWRAKNIGATQISLMTESLGRLLRGTLHEEEGLITIQQEINFIDDYIYIQSLRYDNQLRFRKDISEKAMSGLIPKLTIQPLIENAIRYGLEENMDGCDIYLEIGKTKDRLHICVMNSGSSIDPNIIELLEQGNYTSQGSGIGLMNIHKRLRLNFGDKYSIRFGNSSENATILIEIPYKTE